MPGIQEFTYLNTAKETVRGTPVAPVRKWLGDTTGILGEDIGLDFHEGESRGRRGVSFRVTQTTEDASLKVSGQPTFDDLFWPLSSINGAPSVSGAGADKTAAFAPSMTASNAPSSVSVDVGDDTQNWRLQYVMWKRFKLSSGIGKVTKIEGDLFAQRAIKTAKATPADPASSPKIVGGHWTVKFAATFAGLAGASVQTALLVDSSLECITGLVWEHYQAGNLYGEQHVETAFDGTFTMTVESTAFAVSEFYDKAKSQTLDYVRYKNTSPVVLGGSFPSIQWDFPVFWKVPQVIADSRDGINLWKIEGRLTDDGTNPTFSPTLVSSLSALP